MSDAATTSVTHSVMDATDSTQGKSPTPAQLAARWKPGRSANPGGRGRTSEDVRVLAKTYTTSALRRLAALAGLSSGEDKLIKPTGTPSVQLAAAVALLDRAWGRPEASLHVTGDGGGPALGTGEAELLIAAIRAEIARRAQDAQAVESTATALPAPQMAETPESPDPAPDGAK